MSLTNTQYDTIMRQYEARQIENRHITKKRMQEVYERCPKLKELDASISSVSVSREKRLLDGETESLDLLKQELRELIAQKEQLLNQMGYPSDYLEPSYRCPDCRDTGYIGSEKCHCFKQAAIDLVYTQSNMRRILEQENFDTFSFEYYSKEDGKHGMEGSSYMTAQSAVSQCKDFIRNFDSSFENLFIYGDTGVGKTFLSNCVAKELLDTGHSVIYFTAFELFHIFEKATFQKSRDKDGLLNGDYQNLFDCDLLIIDDLGTEFSNSFTTSQLFLCLNERILRQKSTIISTNLNITQLAELYSERTFSRITSYYTMIKMLGLDIRILKKLKSS